MFNSAVSVCGYYPNSLIYCPECGCADIKENYGEALLSCKICGLECYIIEGENSHDE